MIARPKQLLIALIAEAAVGYPTPVFAKIGHPVTWIGAVIGRLEGQWNRGGSARQRMIGAVRLLLVASGSAGIGVGAEAVAGQGRGLVVIAVVATTGLAQRNLYDHVRAVAGPLRDGDVQAARTAVARIVGRDTDDLDEQGVALAATESLAEKLLRQGRRTGLPVSGRGPARPAHCSGWSWG